MNIKKLHKNLFNILDCSVNDNGDFGVWDSTTNRVRCLYREWEKDPGQMFIDIFWLSNKLELFSKVSLYKKDYKWVIHQFNVTIKELPDIEASTPQEVIILALTESYHLF